MTILDYNAGNVVVVRVADVSILSFSLLLVLIRRYPVVLANIITVIDAVLEAYLAVVTGLHVLRHCWAYLRLRPFL